MHSKHERLESGGSDSIQDCRLRLGQHAKRSTVSHRVLQEQTPAPLLGWGSGVLCQESALTVQRCEMEGAGKLKRGWVAGHFGQLGLLL